MTEQHEGHFPGDGHDHGQEGHFPGDGHDHGQEGQRKGGGGGLHTHGVDPSDPERRATPGALTDDAGAAAPGQIRNPIVPPDALPGD